MKEDYVSLEVEKILQKKGFNLPSLSLYLVQKWLREEKDIHIELKVCDSGYFAMICRTDGSIIEDCECSGPNEGGMWNTYEEAMNVGIEHALEYV